MRLFFQRLFTHFTFVFFSASITFLLLLPCNLFSQNIFTWDNATVYFVITDRFYDGSPGNNFPYGRTADPVGGFQGGDLQGLTQKISEGYFDDLGVDALWITPPYEQIHGAVPGYWNGYPNDFHYGYHGYYALDFTEVDANMGTAADLQAMVDTAHAHGIRIILDVVLNHVGYETVADAAEFNLGDLGNPWDPNNVPNVNDPNWCNWWTDSLGVAWIRKGNTSTDFCAPACGGGDLAMCLAGLPDIRTELTTPVELPQILKTKWSAAKEAQELAELDAFFLQSGLPRTPANYVIKWLTDWVREYGIDGFRIDTYKHVERSVWGTLKTQAQIAFDQWKAANPSKVLDDNDFWMVGEWFGHGPNKNLEAATVGQTDALINFQFQGQAANPAALNSTYAAYAAINADPEWNFLSYISSHDTELFNRNDLYDGATSLLLAPGAVQIFYGDETQRMPLNTGTDQDTRSMMNWSSINMALRTHWGKLGTFRRNHPAIGVGTHTQLNASPYVFMRKYESVSQGICDKIVAAVGVPPGNQTFNVAAAFSDGDQIRDAYSNQIAAVANGQVTFTVGSQGVVLMEYVSQPACIVVDIAPTDCYSATPVTVTITAADISNPGTPPDIFYTFNPNADPANLSQWTPYTAPFVLAQSQQLFAFAQDANGNRSEVRSQQFTIGSNPTMTIRWNPQGTCTTPRLYAWNLNGLPNSAIAPWPGVPMTDPDGDGWYEYTLNAAFANVIFNCGSNQNQTGNLFACGNACFQGSPANGAWVNCPNFNNTTVILNPPGGNFQLGSVTLSANGVNAASIYYTTDGGIPDSTSQLYIQPFPVTSAMGNPVVVKAIAYNAAGEPSDVVTGNYTFDPAMTLYWNLQGTCNNPHLYAWNLNGQPNTPIAPWPGVPMTDTNGDGWYEYSLSAVNAMVIFNCGSNQNQTPDLSATGNSCFQGPAPGGAWVTCPDFSNPSVAIVPAGGNHASGSTVSVQLVWAEATEVYYTTDGTTPNNNSTPYTSSFDITGSAGDTIVVKAIAYSASQTSPVSTAVFTFGSNCPSSLNLSGIIDPGVYYAGQTILVNGTVGAGPVILRAGYSISLDPGFEVNPFNNGGTLTVEMVGCP